MGERDPTPGQRRRSSHHSSEAHTVNASHQGQREPGTGCIIAVFVGPLTANARVVASIIACWCSAGAAFGSNT